MKRILLFIVTNLAVMLVLGIAATCWASIASSRPMA